jgi:hypothetical protein
MMFFERFLLEAVLRRPLASKKVWWTSRGSGSRRVARSVVPLARAIGLTAFV